MAPSEVLLLHGPPISRRPHQGLLCPEMTMSSIRSQAGSGGVAEPEIFSPRQHLTVHFQSEAQVAVRDQLPDPFFLEAR